MITPEEYEEIADLPDDLAFLSLEAKYRFALDQKHHPNEGYDNYAAVRSYINHTKTAASTLQIDGSTFWGTNLDQDSGPQEAYRALQKMIEEIDQFAVVTRIRYARQRLSASGDRVQNTVKNAIGLGADASAVDASSTMFDASYQKMIPEGETTTERARPGDAPRSFLTFAESATLTDESRMTELADLSPTGQAHDRMQRSVDLLSAALGQWPTDPRIGHNNPPGSIDFDIEKKEIDEVEGLIELLRSQPVHGNLAPRVLSNEIAKARPVFERLKRMGDSYLTKLAESAGTESGKLFSPTGVIAIAIAFYLDQALRVASEWISLLGK